MVDFPMFEKGEGRLTACHHPFTAPKIENISELSQHPLALLARAYDMVLNGSEIGGGSIRIHSSGWACMLNTQYKCFRLVQCGYLTNVLLVRARTSSRVSTAVYN